MTKQMSAIPFEPMIGVVVPVFRHSGLVVEALTSLEQQVDHPDFSVAIVNDGCPYPETDLVCASASAASTNAPIHYLKRLNGGLSAARNTGIAFLLARYPSMAGIYFLDADNRLRPHALARMAAALKEHEDADWFYPDIDMFGLNLVAQYGGEYSPLLHTSTNLSEAGSLVRRRVFDGGVAFDETMRQGFEDWDFWLGARERGMKGRHLPHMGFNYRKRPESMLASSTRDEAEIKAFMRRKRRSLFQIKNLLALEATEAPRYAIVLDAQSVSITLDPIDRGRVIPMAEFIEQYWRWHLRPDVHFSPPFVAFMSSSVYEALRENRVLNWVFWDLEARLRNCNFAATLIGGFAGIGAEISTQTRVTGGLMQAAHVLIASSDFLRELCSDANSLEWLYSVRELAFNFRTVSVSSERLREFSQYAAASGFYASIISLHDSPFRGASKNSWKWTQSGVPDRHSAYRILRAAANQGVVFPVRPDGRRHIGVLLSFADFGGAEKVAFNVASVFRAAGFVPHLVLFRTGNIHLPPNLQHTFESFLWVTSEGLMRWSGDDFNGTRLSWWSQKGDRDDVVGMLAWFDAVLNCQSGDAHGVMGELRQRGVLTLTHQHLVEYSKAGRPGGSPMLAKAFEHGYSAILTGSRALRSWFVANGVPQAKLFNVDNAPSYEISEAALLDMARERIERVECQKPLQVMFGARFDMQKGLDRVADIIEATLSLHVKWRVVGRAIVGEDPTVGRIAEMVELEAPVYTEDALTGLYRWARRHDPSLALRRRAAHRNRGDALRVWWSWPRIRAASPRSCTMALTVTSCRNRLAPRT